MVFDYSSLENYQNKVILRQFFYFNPFQPLQPIDLTFRSIYPSIFNQKMTQIDAFVIRFSQDGYGF